MSKHAPSASPWEVPLLSFAIEEYYDLGTEIFYAADIRGLAQWEPFVVTTPPFRAEDEGRHVHISAANYSSPPQIVKAGEVLRCDVPWGYLGGVVPGTSELKLFSYSSPPPDVVTSRFLYVLIFNGPITPPDENIRALAKSATDQMRETLKPSSQRRLSDTVRQGDRHE
jgi:hypothetical protein